MYLKDFRLTLVVHLNTFITSEVVSQFNHIGITLQTLDI